MPEAQACAHNSEDKWKNRADWRGKGKWEYCIRAMQRSYWSGERINIKGILIFLKQRIRQGTFIKLGVIFFNICNFYVLKHPGTLYTVAA